MNRTFEPWIGSEYERPRVRILILGESHYNEGYAPPADYTRAVIRMHIRGDGKRHPYWTKIARVVTSDPYDTSDDRQRFWSQVAFFNYVQEFLPGPRNPPTPEMWSGSVTTFRETLVELRPGRVLVVGKRLWENMASEHSPGPVLPGPNPGEPTRLYETVPPEFAVAGVITHPSGGLN